MNEPQVWTLIGVFAGALIGMMTLMTTTFTRVVRTEVSGLRSELKGDINGLRAELKGDIAELRTELKTDISGLRQDIHHLDRDVSALMKHTFGIDRD